MNARGERTMKTFEEAEKKSSNPFYIIWWIQDHEPCNIHEFRNHFIIEKASREDQRIIFHNIRDHLINLNAMGFFQPCLLFDKRYEPELTENPFYFETAPRNTYQLEISITGKRFLDTLDTSCELLAEHTPRESMWVTPYYRKVRGKTDSDIFVLMPFKEMLNPVYEVIKKVVTKLRRECHRADDLDTYPSPERRNEIIRDIIWPKIASSRHIIADLTGLNPNVFYELGMADTIGKPITFIMDKTQEMIKTPFDVTHREIHKYDRNQLAEFESQLIEILKL
jgi:hypothetical protein